MNDGKKKMFQVIPSDSDVMNDAIAET